MTSLEGKVLAITGAASGVSRATAILFAPRGASVSLADVQEVHLQQTTTEVQKLTPSGHVYCRVVVKARKSMPGSMGLSNVAAN